MITSPAMTSPLTNFIAPHATIEDEADNATRYLKFYLWTSFMSYFGTVEAEGWSALIAREGVKPDAGNFSRTAALDWNHHARGKDSVNIALIFMAARHA
jgi:hypothetical protein